MHFSLESLRAAAQIVYRQVPATPQYDWPLLSRHAGLTVWVKHENHTQTGAFKIRGGVLYMHRLKERQPDCPGVIAATRGNHGQSIAVSATHQGLRSVICVPEGNNPEKNAAMIAQGAELVIHGSDFQESLEHARQLAAAEGLHMVAAFDPTLVQGVASYALELFAAAGRLMRFTYPLGSVRESAGCPRRVTRWALQPTSLAYRPKGRPAMRCRSGPASRFPRRALIRLPTAWRQGCLCPTRWQ